MMIIDLYKNQVVTDCYTDETYSEVLVLTVEEAIERGFVDQVTISIMEQACHDDALKWNGWCDCEQCASVRDAEAAR